MKIGLTGHKGRVTQLIIKELLSDKWAELELSCTHAREIDNNEKENVASQYLITSDYNEFFSSSDVIIDFTLPEALSDHLSFAQEHNKALVIGTTGFNEDQEQLIQNASRSIPVVYAANMSIGVNLLMALVEKAAEKLDADWDIEIAESHHKYKIDAPSGTALALGKSAATGRAQNLDNISVTSREGNTGIRQKGTIGFAVSRGGDVVGEHSLTFYGEGERISFQHIATDRSLFAKGALRAAQWIQGKEPGLYTMHDVLDL